jgi:tetratricopeptide (TPR) repeat protein
MIVVVAICAWKLNAQDPFTAGLQSLSRHDTTAAIEAFLKATQDRRNRSEAEYQLAAIAARRNDRKEAAMRLDRSIAADEDNVHTLMLRADLLMSDQRPAEAMKLYRRAAKLAPANPDFALALGKALLAVDSLDAAVVQFSGVKLRAPNNPDAYEALGDAFAKQGVSIMAMTNYRGAVDRAPKNIRIRMKLAGFLLEERRYNEAVKALREIHDIDSTYAQAYLDEAEVFFRAKMFRQAIPPLRRYRQLQSPSARVDSIYIQALVSAGDHTSAAKVLKEILRTDSSSAENWRMYAHSLVDARDFDGAIGAFVALQRRESLTSSDEYLLGKAYLQVGNDTSALKALERAVVGDSLNCDPYYDLGSLHMRGRNYARAAEMFERKIHCDSSSLGAYLNAGACHMVLADKGSDRIGELARARELFIQARMLSPENLTVRFRLAQCLVLADSQERAKEEYKEVLRIAGSNPTRYRKEAGEAHVQIAMYYASKSQPDRAIASFASAERLDYETAAMQLNWGLAILQVAGSMASEEEARGKSVDAVKRFRRAVQLDPGSAPAHFWLGEGVLRLRIPGDNESVHKYTEEACQEFKKALAIDPHHEGALKETKLRGCH